MAEVLRTALDPLHKSVGGRVRTSVRTGRIRRAHAPRKRGGGGTSRPCPRPHLWPGRRRSTPEPTVPLINARTFPLPFKGAQIPPAWRVSPV